MTTDNTQGLDEIMDKIYDLAYEHLPERGIAIGTDRIKQAILDWHNRQVEEVLDRLAIDTKLTYDGGGDLLDAVVDFIVDECNKLKR